MDTRTWKLRDVYRSPWQPTNKIFRDESNILTEFLANLKITIPCDKIGPILIHTDADIGIDFISSLRHSNSPTMHIIQAAKMLTKYQVYVLGIVPEWNQTRMK